MTTEAQIEQLLSCKMMNKLMSVNVDQLLDIAKSLVNAFDDESMLVFEFSLKALESRLSENDFLAVMLEIEQLQSAA